jgi:ABC-type oligopeptide transport system substrate-binding subunit
MKRIFFALIALIAVFAFVTGAAAAEKKATQPKAMQVSGAVTAYLAPSQAEKSTGMIAVKDAKGKAWSFDLPADSKIKGEVKKGARATVTYKKEGGKMIATAVSVAAVKKSSQPKAKS